MRRQFVAALIACTAAAEEPGRETFGDLLVPAQTSSCVTSLVSEPKKYIVEVSCGPQRLTKKTFVRTEDSPNLLALLVERMAQQGFNSSCNQHFVMTESLGNRGYWYILCLHQR